MDIERIDEKPFYTGVKITEKELATIKELDTGNLGLDSISPKILELRNYYFRYLACKYDTPWFDFSIDDETGDIVKLPEIAYESVKNSE